MIKFIISIAIYLLIASELFAAPTRLLRYPNTSETDIAFVYGGDIYTVPLSGGIARRLTSSEGIERYPRFSQNGSEIAFTAEYDGSNEVYVMPASGGIPQRLTYSHTEANVAERQGPDIIIMQWTPDGESILYRSRQNSWNILVGQLFTIGKSGGLPKELPLPRGGFASMNSDGTKLAYNRIFREYRTWKRYSGGQADDIWIYDLANGQSENITNNPFQDIIPIWHGDKIYYLSDRDFTMNLFCYDLNTKQTRKITNFDYYDVKFPSKGKNHIAFENGGNIYLMDFANENIRQINIEVKEDFPQLRSSLVPVKDRITNADISPSGARALFTARGDIFTVPASKGNIRNLTNTPGIHERSVAWSPDGSLIAYISDQSGNDEIYIIKPDGTGEIQLTNDGNFYRYGLKWSPDSKKLISSDNTRNLYWIDIVSKKKTNIAKSKFWSLSDFDWSPDNQWIAYTNYSDRRTGMIYIYSLKDNTSYPITNEFFNSYGVEFSPGGRFLFFISDRNFKPSFGAFEYNFQYSDMAKIYGVTLQDTTLNPFAVFESDEELGDVKKTTKKKEKASAENPIKIDFTGIESRIFEFPVAAGNYSNLTATMNYRMYFVRSASGQKPKFYYYDAVKKEEKEVGEFSQYVISYDENSILFKSGEDYYISSLKENINTKDGKLDFQDLQVILDRRAEWKQIFNESWRHMKHFFYDPNMHGYNWDSLKIKYEQLLPYVSHRTDLTYIIGEMIGELDAGHAYVSGGDMPKVTSVPIGLLGADFEFDKFSGFYRIKKIYEGMNWEENLRSPLTEPGLNIKNGDYIVAINGVTLNQSRTPFSELINKADKFVEIEINSKASRDGARKLNIKTLKSEKDLRYYDWVETNRRKVDSATGGRIGYVHIPDMSPFNGLNWFVRYFYPQTKKEGMIIDDRYNGGGNVSPMIIERLRRELAIVKYGRNQDEILTNPDAIMTGPMVCLINEQSMSDGDLFPFQFKRLNLGPVIGKRSWGGVVGIYGSLPLLDGSDVRKPEVANFSPDGKWVLEDVGMVPDIEVDNDPWKEYHGTDEQLNRGIEIILDLLRTDTKPKVPALPQFPDKKKDFGK
jgi:tricorn protease